MQSLTNSIQSQFWAMRDYLSPVAQESHFDQDGRITPEEFVAAGDFLVYKFPTWEWQSGDASKRRPYLPDDKQYLVSRNVPCLRRCSDMAYTDEEEGREAFITAAMLDGDDDDAVLGGSGSGGSSKQQASTSATSSSLLGGRRKRGKNAGSSSGGNDDDWVATHMGRPTQSTQQDIGEIPDVADGSFAHDNNLTSSLRTGDNDDSGEIPEETENIPDMDDMPEIGEDEDEAAAKTPTTTTTPTRTGTTKNENEENTTESAGNVLQVRTYNCFITYDKYYQTPRCWLSGYDEAKKPLPPRKIFDDISPDFVQKTVTIESFIHLEGTFMASIHPCKHADVMTKIIRGINEGVKKKSKKGGGWSVGMKKKKDKEKELTEEPNTEAKLRVDQYLLAFLKLMSNITPTIELDFTAEI